MSSRKVPGRKVLGRTDILTVDDTKYDYASVPEWGGDVRLRSLNAAEALAWAEDNEKKDLRNTAGLRLLVLTAVDEDGAQLFEASHVNALQKKSNRALKRSVAMALILSGFSEEKDLPAEKNDSGETPSGDSPTV